MHGELIYPFLLCSGLLAGFIDAIVGGGGLITIPALLFAGLSPHLALGTNKLAATAGVFSSTWVYLRKNIYRLQLWLWVVLAAFIGAVFGTVCIHFLSATWLSKIIPFLLIVIVIYMSLPKTLKSKGQGMAYRPPKTTSGLTGLLLGFYDGFFGPGTGSFWTTILIALFKLDILQATAIAKLMNFTSNIASAIIFAYYGTINYSLGFALMIGYIIGSYTGAHSAIKHGRRLIKPLFLILVTAIAIKMLWH